MSPFLSGSMYGAGIVLLACAIAFTIFRYKQEFDREVDKDLSLGFDDINEPPHFADMSEPVNPWNLQRQLMTASAQSMPKSPTVSNTSLLYWALLLEELHETTEAKVSALSNAWYSRAAHLTDHQRAVLWSMTTAAQMMHTRSKKVRELIEVMGPFEYTISREFAKPIFDGTTDVAVVNSGFCLASGLPGSEGYLEVLTSNLSKRNDKGIIDKTPDGKWIKGPNYIEPDLDTVLDHHEVYGELQALG